VDPGGRSVTFSGGGLEVEIAAQTGIEVGGNAKPFLTKSAEVSFTLSGYLPQSAVGVFLTPLSNFESGVAVREIATNSTEAKAVALANVSISGQVEFAADISVPDGEYLLQIVGTDSSRAVLSLAIETTVVASQIDGPRGWTRFLSATNELKIYARGVVNAGKITFVVNGNELAWIRATSAADSKINVASDGMVRSVFVSDMLVGRNVIEIYVDGVRIDRRIFTR
jgi:hypothetical protein